MDSNNRNKNRRFQGKNNYKTPSRGQSSDASSKEQLLEKIKDLEQQIVDLKNQNVPAKTSASDIAGQKEQITTSFMVSKDSKVSPKFEALMSEDFTAVSKEDSKVKVKLCEKDIVDNEIILGDTLLIEVHKDLNIKSVKVAQRAKRAEVESLVTQRDNTFYAVSQFATHKLLNYEVMAKAILKGFEVTLILPEGHEKESYYALVKFVEGVVSTEDSVYAPTHTKPTFDPRVIEDDDLV
ncbi:hypothetical protein GW755_00675 [bacterium]|nr:hypothetical protein [bacterium]